MNRFVHNLYKTHAGALLLTNLKREAAGSSNVAELQWYSPEKRK
jgi:hypothetical protein